MPTDRIVSARAGITLIELIVVMVILILAASLAVPVVQRSFNSQRVTRAADLVRAELNRARIQAMRTGEIYGFFYFPESAKFKVAPFNDEVTRVLQETGSSRKNRNSSNFNFDNETLPNGVLFATGNTIQDSRSADAIQQNSGSVNRLHPVLFYPDGSSQSAKLYLRSDDHNRDLVEIKLRGMTGTATSAPVVKNRR